MFPILVVVSTYLPTQVAVCKATVTKAVLRAIRLAGHVVAASAACNATVTNGVWCTHAMHPMSVTTPWRLPHAPKTHKRGMGPPVVQATLRHGNLGRIMLSHVDSRYRHSRISEDRPPCTLYLWPGSTPQSCISWLSLHSASGQGVLPSQVAFVYHLWPRSTPQPLLLL